jgi:hypothetical protein
MPKREALAAKPDGRLYSRATRRCVAILKNLNSKQRFELMDLARELSELALPEFLRKEGNAWVPISADRIRDYVGHLHALGLIVGDEREFGLSASFTKPSTDAEWAQSLSDIALEHLASMVKTKPGDFRDRLEKEIRRLFRDQRVPTLSIVISELGIEGTHQEELFRWV